MARFTGTFRRRRPPRGRFFRRKASLCTISCTVVLLYLLVTRSSEKKSAETKRATVTSLRSRPARTSSCPFRNYPPRRYYGLDTSPRLDFLQHTDYIYGQWPVRLETSADTAKLCVNQSEWQDASSSEASRLPFADGTNPSILRIERLPMGNALRASLTQKYSNAAYLATLCMTNSQCRWNDSPQEVIEYKLSEREKPVTVRTILLVLDAQFQVLQQTTLQLERNAPWGRKHKQVPSTNNGNYPLEVKAFDDARLFVFQHEVWVSYREGPGFGYEKQVLNPIHFTLEETSIKATVKASETTAFCCGRNMALMEHPKTEALQSLTWADPVTVIDVDTTPLVQGRGQHRRLQLLEEDSLESSTNHRRLAQKKSSHFHGTNAFMVPVPNSDLLLGMGHFHRPPGRDKNDYARFGHHYTHAFFTISASSPHRLVSASQEFVFPSPSHGGDAEIIQFASGLEIDPDSKQVVIAYGINDCEGAAVRVDLERVERMLKPVQRGQEVIDLMSPLIN